MTIYWRLRKFKTILNNSATYRDAFKMIQHHVPETWAIQPIISGSLVRGLIVWDFNNKKTEILIKPIKFE